MNSGTDAPSQTATMHNDQRSTRTIRCGVFRCDNALASATGLSFPRNGITLNVLANRIPGAVELAGNPTDTPVFLLVKHADLFVLTHLYSYLSVRLLVTF